jgi:hypothetical protein
LRRRPATRGFQGGAASGEARLARGGGAAPVSEFARELDLLSVRFVCCCASSDLCGFASFHCLCMLSPLSELGLGFHFSGEVSLISVDLVHSTAYSYAEVLIQCFCCFFHFILLFDGEGSFLGFPATVGEFTFPYHSSLLVSYANY